MLSKSLIIISRYPLIVFYQFIIFIINIHIYYTYFSFNYLRYKDTKNYQHGFSI